MTTAFYESKIVGLRPQTIAAVDDDNLQALIEFNPRLKALCGHRFANWLQGVLAHEWERRQASGSIELCSHEMPMLPIPDLSRVRSWLTMATYSETGSSMLFDELLFAIDTQTRFHLDQYQTLLERENNGRS
jgi:hypothetical protein